jgi:hypothetical protein
VYEQSNDTKPFTYQFTLDNTQSAINAVLKNVHPVGYLIKFLQQFDFSETCNVSDVVEITVSLFNYYNGDMSYDGANSYSGDTTIPLTDDSIIK